MNASNASIRTGHPLSVEELADALAVCRRTAYRLVVGGEIRGHRIGRQWRVFEDDVRDYLARRANRAAVFPPPPTMICSEPPPEPPKPDSDYVRGIKRAIVIAAGLVPAPDGERARFASEIIHALMEEIDD